MFGVIGIRRIAYFVVIFIENRLGDDILLRRPIPKIPQSAAFAAEREFGIRGRVNQLLANRAPALHGKLSLP
jgi:hypothetical protein